MRCGGVGFMTNFAHRILYTVCGGGGHLYAVLNGVTHRKLIIISMFAAADVCRV